MLQRVIKEGPWTWDDINQQLVFKYDTEVLKKSCLKPVLSKPTPAEKQLHVITFKDALSANDLESYNQIIDEKDLFQSGTVVKLADIKILALFLVEQTLPAMFMNFFRSSEVDQWLRCVLVYMHYFVQTVSDLRKNVHLMFPPAKENEQPYAEELCQNLTDLRTVVGRQYAVLCVMLSQQKKQSMNVELIYPLLCISSRVVWIALLRKNLDIIEMEMGRLFCTQQFNCFRHKPLSWMTQKIHKILYGKHGRPYSKFPEQNVLTTTENSPVITDFLNSEDHPLLLISQEDCYNKDERLRFLAKSFFLPEDMLVEEGIAIGILGQQWTLFDSMLTPLSFPKLTLEEKKSCTFDNILLLKIPSKKFCE